ncbi:MAG: TRAP transporter small permease subunit, partial [Spirochaetales bacterium]|nr:TRAP transporter small permease subunit [Spirochaetales bacterium]
MLENSAVMQGSLITRGYSDYFVIRPVLSKVLKLIQHTGAIIFSLFLSVQTFKIISTQKSTQEFTPVLHIPLWLINLGCFIGSVIILLFALEKLLRLF